MDNLYGENSIIESAEISTLFDNKYTEFFNAPDSIFDAIWKMDGTNRHEYPQIMNEFKEEVSRAMSKVNKVQGIQLRDKPIWARMRDKYFDGKAYVYPDEMIQHVGEFTSSEAIAYLWYCTCYKERYCDGAYGSYAKDGLIGKALQRLRTQNDT